MKHIYMIIGNAGDGSNFVDIVRCDDGDTLEYIQKLAESGDECYASGDGLQCRTLSFPDDFDVDAWVKTHFYDYTRVEDFM